MKIAYLVNTYPRASHTFIRREIASLERQGVDVHRFAMRSDRAGLVDAADLAEDHLTEHVLQTPALTLALSALAWVVARPSRLWPALRQAMRCGSRGAGGRLRHLIYLAEAAHVARRCRQLGIMHLHAHFGTNSATVALLSRLLGGPHYSFTVHGPEEFDAPVALSLRDKVHHARFCVTISSYGRSQMCRWADFADWPRLKVVHCGIEPARFASPLALPPGGPRLVAIGRLSEQKGFALLIEALALAVPRHPDLHLTLVGDGELRCAIQSAISAANLQPHVTLTGWLEEAGVRAELGAAQALILPSFAEGLPMALMEAMAAARPVIATTIAGIPELVTRETGWLVPAGDAQALADAIDAFAAMPHAALVAMGQAARLRVFARHDADVEAARLANLFAQARP